MINQEIGDVHGTGDSLKCDIRPGLTRLWSIALMVTLISGCVSSERGFRTYHARVQKITPDGYVEFTSGARRRLAGVRLRSVAETQEPELLNVANDIVRRENSVVRVEEHVPSKSVVVHYTQRIYYYPEYILPITMAKKVLKPTTTATVNELLIVMAAAHFDPTVGVLGERAARRCESARDKAERALCVHDPCHPLSDYKAGPAFLYTSPGGFRARVARGDVRGT